MVLTLASLLVQQLTILESCTLCLLFIGVLVMTRGFLHCLLVLLNIPESMATAAPASSVSSLALQSSKYYAVARGLTPRIYRTLYHAA